MAIRAYILDRAGLTGDCFGDSIVFALVLGFLAWMLWISYKKAIPALTAGLNELEADATRQLRPVSQRSPRQPLLFAIASVFLMVLALIAFEALLDRFHS